MIRKLKSGGYRLYSRKKDKSGKRKNLGTFKSLAAAKKHERSSVLQARRLTVAIASGERLTGARLSPPRQLPRA